MPHDSPWPVVLALAVFFVFVSLVLQKYGVAAVFGIACLGALFGWHSREPQES